MTIVQNLIEKMILMLLLRLQLEKLRLGQGELMTPEKQGWPQHWRQKRQTRILLLKNKLPWLGRPRLPRDADQLNKKRLLPPLQRGLADENFRIREASADLLGSLMRRLTDGEGIEGVEGIDVEGVEGLIGGDQVAGERIAGIGVGSVDRGIGVDEVGGERVEGVRMAVGGELTGPRGQVERLLSIPH